jgi:hypothetical protein
VRLLLLGLTACGRLGFDAEVGPPITGMVVDASPTCGDACTQRLQLVFPRGGEMLFWPDMRLAWSAEAIAGDVRASLSLDGVTFDMQVDLPNTGAAGDPWDTSHRDLMHYVRIESIADPSIKDTTTSPVFVQSD